MAKKLTAAEMHRLARLGAAAKLAQLEREIDALKRAFPGLKAQPSPGPAAASRRGCRARNLALPRSASQPACPDERRRAQGRVERMKRYWDARRKAGNK